MTSIAQPASWWAQVAPDKAAVILDGEELTYAQLDAWANRAAALLAHRGLTPGARAGQLAGNSLAYCVTTLAILKAGGIVVPMSTRLTVGEIVTLTDSSEPVLVVTDGELGAKAREASVKGCGYAVIDIEEIAALRSGNTVPFPVADVDPDDPAALIYTSGTTGTPKGVIFSHRSILGMISEWGLSEEGFSHDMRLLMVLPLGGAPGTIWGIIHTFIRGATMILHRSFRPNEALASLTEHQVTAMVGVPILYEQIAKQEGFADADLSAFSTAHVGGARVSDEMLRAYGRKNVLLRQIYGMTETGGSATANTKADAINSPEFCGRGNVFTRIRVVRDDGTDCDPGEPGQILVKGPSVTPGYWKNPEATAATIVDGWVHSGDLGTLDETGNLRMVDRLKDLIISGGLNISPTEIENVIDQLPEIAEVAVIPADDEKFGETPAALVRLTDEIEASAIIAHCNEHLADFKVPRYVIVVEEALPRMASGKLNKRELRAAHPDIAGAHAKVR